MGYDFSMFLLRNTEVEQLEITDYRCTIVTILYGI